MFRAFYSTDVDLSLDFVARKAYYSFMNIFILDTDITRCAEYHVDKHVVKMPLEAAQLLCSVYWIDFACGYVPQKITPEQHLACKMAHTEDYYKLSHYNHPCAVWARTSLDNFEWLHCYAHALNDEYGYRYGGKSHKSLEVVNRLPTPNLPRIGLTPFVQAMPDDYKSDNAVDAYRAYYIGDKSHLAAWKHRGKPDWY